MPIDCTALPLTPHSTHQRQEASPSTSTTAAVAPAAASTVWEQATRAHAGAAWAWRWLALSKLREGQAEACVAPAQYAIRAAPGERRGWATLGR